MKGKRPRHHVPEFVRRALEEQNLMEAYDERPDYRRNDYLGWIQRRTATRQTEAAAANA